MSEDERPCPACGGVLKQRQVERFMLGCSRCQGHWLDISGSVAVVRGLLTEAELDEAGRQPGQAQDRSAGTPYRAPPQEDLRARACPFCDVVLRKVRIEEIGIELDICKEHGTWFDARELRGAAEHYRLEIGVERGEEEILDRLITRALTPSRRAEAWTPFW